MYGEYGVFDYMSKCIDRYNYQKSLKTEPSVPFYMTALYTVMYQAFSFLRL